MGQVIKVADGLDAEGRRALVPAPAEAPDVTVIVPCYNVADFVEQCIDSIFDNEVVRLEVLAVNDGSPDDTPEILARLAGKYEGLTVLDKPNGGYGAACNLGIDCAHGAYVAIVEPDDYVRPGFYDRVIAFAGTFDELPQIIKTPYIRVYMPNTPEERLYNCAYRGRITPDHQPFTLADEPRLIQHHPSIWSALYLRSFLDEKGIRFMEVPGAGWVDNPFLVETLAQADSIAYLDEPFYCYREDLPGSSSMLKSTGLAFERWNQMMDILEELGVDDPAILSAHYVRGFTYLTGILEEANVSGTEAEAEMKHMFDRMDPKLVLASPYLGNDRKELFCRVQDITDASWDRLAHLGSLADEFWYSWGSNGPAFALSRVGVYFARRLHLAENDPTKTSSAGI